MARLEDLIVDASELDRELVADVLSPYVRLDRASETTYPLPAWDELKNDYKVVVLLVARKAMVALDWTSEEALSPVEISRRSGIPGGSVRPALQRLVGRRLVVEESGRYRVPNWAINQIKSALVKEEVADD
jgi:hypothetical protein